MIPEQVKASSRNGSNMKTLIRNLTLISAMALAALSSTGCIVAVGPGPDPGPVCASYSAYYGDYLKVYDCEDADAYNGSTVEAYWGSTVYAHNGSLVYAYNGSLVYAYAGSTVYAYPGSEVIAYAGSWVYVTSSSALTAQSSQALTAETSDSGAGGEAASAESSDSGAGGEAATTGGDRPEVLESRKHASEAAGPAKITADPGAHVEQMSGQQ